MTFECHITMRVAKDQTTILKRWVESLEGWTFSMIAGDPLLGDHTFCYATGHFYEPMEAMVQTEAASEALSKQEWIGVLRRKVELVMFDERKVNGVWIKV